MSNTVEKVLNIAEQEVGYLEKASNYQLDSKQSNAGSGNYTKYWRDLSPSLQGQPWCNAWINWIFTKAYGATTAKKLLCTDGSWSYYTPTSAQYFKNKNQWHSSPQKGDVIYFKNTSRIHHVGLVEKVDSLRVYTIEGNTSSGNNVVIANGGGVFKKSYLIGSSSIAGYGRPNYDTETKSGWHEEDGGWRFYLGNTGKPITSDWYQWTGKDGNKYWSYFLDTGLAVQDNWYKYKNEWYYFHDDCRMAATEWIAWKSKDYYLGADGKMVADAYVKSTTKNVWYYLNSDGVWDTSKDVATPPPLGKIKK